MPVDVGARRPHYNLKVQAGALEALLKKLPRPEASAPVRHDRVLPRAARHLNIDETIELIAAYEAGATVYQLGDRFGIDRKTVGRILARNQTPTRSPGIPEEKVDQIVQFYQDGWSTARIAEYLAISVWTVRRRLRERGVTMRSRAGAAR